MLQLRSCIQTNTPPTWLANYRLQHTAQAIADFWWIMREQQFTGWDLKCCCQHIAFTRLEITTSYPLSDHNRYVALYTSTDIVIAVRQTVMHVICK